MADSILLDSVLLIDHFNGIETATEYLRSTQVVFVGVLLRQFFGRWRENRPVHSLRKPLPFCEKTTKAVPPSPS